MGAAKRLRTALKKAARVKVVGTDVKTPKRHKQPTVQGKGEQTPAISAASVAATTAVHFIAKTMKLTVREKRVAQLAATAAAAAVAAAVDALQLNEQQPLERTPVLSSNSGAKQSETVSDTPERSGAGPSNLFDDGRQLNDGRGEHQMDNGDGCDPSHTSKKARKVSRLISDGHAASKEPSLSGRHRGEQVIVQPKAKYAARDIYSHIYSITNTVQILKKSNHVRYRLKRYHLRDTDKQSAKVQDIFLSSDQKSPAFSHSDSRPRAPARCLGSENRDRSYRDRKIGTRWY